MIIRTMIRSLSSLRRLLLLGGEDSRAVAQDHVSLSMFFESIDSLGLKATANTSGRIFFFSLDGPQGLRRDHGFKVRKWLRSFLGGRRYGLLWGGGLSRFLLWSGVGLDTR